MAGFETAPGNGMPEPVNPELVEAPGGTADQGGPDGQYGEWGGAPWAGELLGKRRPFISPSGETLLEASLAEDPPAGMITHSDPEPE